MEATFRSDVHGHTEQGFEILLQADHVEQAAVRLPFHQEIQVTLLGCLAPSHGAIHTDASGTMPPRQLEDRRALLAALTVEGHHMHPYSPRLGGSFASRNRA